MTTDYTLGRVCDIVAIFDVIFKLGQCLGQVTANSLELYQTYQLHSSIKRNINIKFL